jgi:hypothetical protein
MAGQQARAAGAGERLLVQRLAADAARGAGLGAQALDADIAAAVDAHAVAAVGEAGARGFEAAQLAQVARQVGLVEVGDERRDRFVARVGRRAGDLAEGFAARLGGVAAQLGDQGLPALADQVLQFVGLLRGECHFSSP